MLFVLQNFYILTAIAALLHKTIEYKSPDQQPVEH